MIGHIPLLSRFKDHSPVSRMISLCVPLLWPPMNELVSSVLLNKIILTRRNCDTHFRQTF